MTPAVEGLEIAVPASIGNVGPGFDALAVAVQLYLRVRVTAVLPARAGQLQFAFRRGPIEGPNLIETALRSVASARGTALPGLAIEVDSEIPPRAGLGSSAAATVAGLLLYEALTEARPRCEWLAAGCRMEGHPDNVAAALHGGLVGSYQLEDGTVGAHVWRWPESIRFVVATPAIHVDTGTARRVLPEFVPRADAVFNLQRVVLLLQAVTGGSPGLLREALRDRLHQTYRRPLVPGLDALLAIEHPDVLGVCLSGAGPSVVALAERHFDAVEDLVAGVYRSMDLPCVVRTLSVHQGELA